MSKLKKPFLFFTYFLGVSTILVFLWLIFPTPTAFWDRVYAPTFKLADNISTIFSKNEKLYEGIECGGFIANENCVVVNVFTTDLDKESFINLIQNSKQIISADKKPAEIDGYSFITILDINAGKNLEVNNETDLLKIWNTTQEPYAIEFRNASYMDREIGIEYYETKDINLKLEGNTIEGNIIKVAVSL